MSNGNDWTQQEIDFLIDNWGRLTLKEIAKRLGKKFHRVQKKSSELKIRNLYQREYAVYFDDEFQFIGTAEECAKRLGVKNVNTIRYFASDSYRKRKKTGLFVIDIGLWRKDE